MAILRKGLNLDFRAMASQLGILNDPIVSFSRASSATRINPLTGLVESVAANVPRLSGIQTLINAVDGTTKTIQPGLLIEGQATNYMAYSRNPEAFGATTGVYVTANYSTAPDGSATATRVLYNGSGVAGSYRYYGNSDTATAGQKRVLSFWLKANSGTPTIRLNDNNGTYGTVTLTNTWKRYYIVGTGNAGSGWQPVICSANGDNTAFDISVWDIQVEGGLFPSSLILTSGAAVTRAADSATVNVSKLWNASEGTFICEVDFGPTSSAYQTIFDLSGNSFQVYRHTSGQVSISGSVPPVVVTRARIATTAQKLSLNGGQVYAGSKTLPSAPANLFLGTNSGLGETLIGTMQQLIYVPYSMDDYTLKSASTLK